MIYYVPVVSYNDPLENEGPQSYYLVIRDRHMAPPQLNTMLELILHLYGAEY